MKIFGYQKDGERLLEMEELSIKCELKELDNMIDFLKDVRNLMNIHGAGFGHEHFSEWRKHKGCDSNDKPDIIIVRNNGNHPQ